jgi:hypothetical protein
MSAQESVVQPQTSSNGAAVEDQTVHVQYPHSTSQVGQIIASNSAMFILSYIEDQVIRGEHIAAVAAVKILKNLLA